jgi:hypothetical protein
MLSCKLQTQSLLPRPFICASYTSFISTDCLEAVAHMLAPKHEHSNVYHMLVPELAFFILTKAGVLCSSAHSTESLLWFCCLAACWVYNITYTIRFWDGCASYISLLLYQLICLITLFSLYISFCIIV